MWHTTKYPLALFVFAALAGCGAPDADPADVAPPDAADAAAPDGAVAPPDAAPLPDAAPDAALDAAPGSDAAPEPDAAPPADAAPADAAPALDMTPPPDAGPDAAPLEPDAAPDPEPEPEPDAGPAPDPGPCEPIPESCNGEDDDCDGATDEGFGLGDACAVGVGACVREGRVVCGPAGEGGAPLAFEGVRHDVPFAELRARGFEPCWQGHYGENGPTIDQLREDCGADEWLVGCGPSGADALQLAATGRRDEVLTQVAPLRTAVHPHNGVDWYYHPDMSWGFAPAGLGVRRQSCDVVEEDGAERLCWHADEGALTRGFRCGEDWIFDDSYRRVVWHRTSLPGAVCSVEPGEPAQAEACDGLDDDCDGRVDEAVPGTGVACALDGLEPCQVARVACVDGAALDCVPVERPPEVEVCNDRDDDCDGVTDEDFGLGEACVSGIGPWARDGVTVCEPPPEVPAGLPFVGVRTDVPLAELEAEGFEPCWQATYGELTPIEDVRAACDEGVLLLGCAPLGSDALTVAAAGHRAEVFTEVPSERDAVHAHNGVDWYFHPDFSWGFTREGDGVDRWQCDVAGDEEDSALRLCWHTIDGRVWAGFRCGATLGLNEEDDWIRVIYQRPRGPVGMCAAP